MLWSQSFCGPGLTVVQVVQVVLWSSRSSGPAGPVVQSALSSGPAGPVFWVVQHGPVNTVLCSWWYLIVQWSSGPVCPVVVQSVLWWSSRSCGGLVGPARRSPPAAVSVFYLHRLAPDLPSRTEPALKMDEPAGSGGTAICIDRRVPTGRPREMALGN